MEKTLSAREIILQAIQESIQAKEKLSGFTEILSKIAEQWVSTLRNGGTIFLFGNGGSAADAQHIAAELVGRFCKNRPGLPAIALTVNTSNLTAIANDFSYAQVFSRQLEALLKKGDLAVALSTSGNSPNVLEGVRTAREKGCATTGFTGERGGKLKALVDFCFCAPSDKTARIQEVHMLAAHILCEIVEEALSP